MEKLILKKKMGLSTRKSPIFGLWLPGADESGHCEEHWEEQLFLQHEAHRGAGAFSCRSGAATR